MPFRTGKEYETKKESSPSKRSERKARAFQPAPLPVSDNVYVIIDPEGRTYSGKRDIDGRRVDVVFEHGLMRTQDEDLMKYMCARGFILFDTYKMEAHNGRIN